MSVEEMSVRQNVRDEMSVDKVSAIPSQTESCITCDKDHYPGFDSRMHVLTRQDLDDLVRDLELPKGKAELLCSRLQGWNLLDAL